VSKLLHYLSSLEAATSDEPAAARADLLASTTALTGYYRKLTGPEVTLSNLFLHRVSKK